MRHPSGRVPISYLFYGLVLFCLLVAILFPYKRFAKTMIGRLEQKSGVELRYQEFAFAAPFGFQLKNAEVYLPARSGRINAYKGEQLLVKFSPLSLLMKDLSLKLEGIGYGGELEGSARLDLPIQPVTGDYELRLKNVRIQELISQFYLRNFKLSGAITGEADVHLEGAEAFSSATGKLQATLSDGQVRNIVIQGLDIPDFAFDKMDAAGILQNGTLQLRHFKVDSDILLGEMEGEIRITPQDIRDSQLNLNARLKPKENDPMNLHTVATLFDKIADRDGYYPFKITGTFRFPQLI